MSGTRDRSTSFFFRESEAENDVKLIRENYKIIEKSKEKVWKQERRLRDDMKMKYDENGVWKEIVGWEWMLHMK